MANTGALDRDDLGLDVIMQGLLFLHIMLIILVNFLYVAAKILTYSTF